MISPVALNAADCSGGKARKFRPSARGYSDQSDMIRAVGAPARAASTQIETLAWHQEFGNARNRLADPACLIRGELANAEAVALRIVAAIKPRQGYAVGIPHDVALGIFPDQDPRWLETAA